MTEKTTYLVEKNIPKPAKRTPISKYPFALMKVGDSFVVPLEEASRARNAIASFTNYWKLKKQGRPSKEYVFSTRTVDDAHLRIWRDK